MLVLQDRLYNLTLGCDWGQRMRIKECPAERFCKSNQIRFVLNMHGKFEIRVNGIDMDTMRKLNRICVNCPSKKQKANEKVREIPTEEKSIQPNTLMPKTLLPKTR